MLGFGGSLEPINEKRMEVMMRAQSVSNANKPLTEKRVNALLNAADPEWQGLILLGLGCGARLLDAANLHWSNLDMWRREVRFDVPKTKRRITLPMTEDVHEYFCSLRRPEDPEAPVFPYCFRMAQDFSPKLSRAFKLLQVNAGLVPVSFNRLRQTFVHLLLSLDVPKDLLAELMGYSDSKHQSATKDAKAAIVARLPRWMH